MPVGTEPGGAVVVSARVSKLASLETIEAKGTAVGFVDKRVKVILGVDEVLAVTETPPLAGTEPPLAGTVPLAELEGVGPVVIGLVDDVCEVELEGACRA